MSTETMQVNDVSARCTVPTAAPDVPPGYTTSEVGVIPQEWEVHSIGESMELINGRAFKPGDWKHHGTPIIRIQNLNDPRCAFNYCNTSVEQRHHVKSGDVLFAWSGTTGTSFGARIWEGPDGFLNQHIFKVVAKPAKLTSIYSFLILQRVQHDIEKQAHGFKTSFVHVKKSDLVKVCLPIPPLPEQRAIAEALLDVDRLLGALESLIAKKRAIKQAAMQQLLTGKTRLPGFSGEWETKRLADIADVDPENLASGTPPNYSFNYISLEQVDSGRLLGHTEERFSEAPSRARRVLRVGDVLMSTVRPNLMSHLLYREQVTNAVCSTGFAVLRVKADQADPSFIYEHLFALPVNGQIERTLAGSNYPAINSRDIQLLEIPCPPSVAEQTAIATVLSDMDGEIAALERRRDKTRAIKQGMMQQLLTGRVRLVEPAADRATTS